MAELLKISSLSTGFDGKTVSPALELTVGPGELVALIGPNGCGKTTLLRTLAGLIKKRGGEALIKGRPLEAYSRRELARIISYLPQSRQAPDITAEALVAHGRFPHLGFSRQLTARDREIIDDAIALTHLEGLRKKRLPQMSGGERQRVYLAMTASQQAELVLLDEPGTYLDIGSRFEAIGLARTLAERGAGVIMTIHDLSDAMYFSSRLCLMDRQGAIIFDGGPEELFSSGLLDSVFGVRAEGMTGENGKRMYFFRPEEHA